MTNKQEKEAATLAFVLAHRGDDVNDLALHNDADDRVDLNWALQQIAGYQRALRKLPLWAATEGIKFPARLALEQCSSQATAEYKNRLVIGDSLVDLTGGFGVDFALMARTVTTAVVVERQASLCRLLKHNLPLLGLEEATVVNGDGVDYLRAMNPVDTIMVDPARRGAAGNKVFALADCTPDLTVIARLLLAKSRRTIVKLSPMLDISEALRQLPMVSEVHLVGAGGECKELLLVLEAGNQKPVTMYCHDDSGDFTYMRHAPYPSAHSWDGELNDKELLHLYEPNATLMKAGCFDQLAAHFRAWVVSRDSHLIVSDKVLPDFPGRHFVIDSMTTFGKRQLRKALSDLDRANITVRNLPMTVAALRKKLRLADGGDTYLFGTTLQSGITVLLRCHRAAP